MDDLDRRRLRGCSIAAPTGHTAGTGAAAVPEAQRQADRSPARNRRATERTVGTRAAGAASRCPGGNFFCKPHTFGRRAPGGARVRLAAANGTMRRADIARRGHAPSSRAGGSRAEPGRGFGRGDRSTMTKKTMREARRGAGARLAAAGFGLPGTRGRPPAIRRMPATLAMHRSAVPHSPPCTCLGHVFAHLCRGHFPSAWPGARSAEGQAEGSAGRMVSPTIVSSPESGGAGQSVGSNLTPPAPRAPGGDPCPDRWPRWTPRGEFAPPSASTGFGGHRGGLA